MVSTAVAQPHIRVSSGTAVPLSPDLFTNASAPGVSVEVGPEFALTDRLHLAVTGTHTRFPLSGRSALDANVTTAWSVSAQVFVHLLDPSAPVQLYTIAGAGATRLNRQPGEVVILCSGIYGPCPSQVIGRDHPESRFRIQGGLGVSVPLNRRVGAFVESTYTGLIGGNNLQYGPVQLGLRFRPPR